MSNVDDQLRQAAAGKDSPIALAVQKREQRQGPKPPRTDRPAAQAAVPAPEPVDAVAVAQALLARSDEIDTDYGDFHKGRDAALKREQDCLQAYRELLRRHRTRINDARWCATEQGKKVAAALTALQTEVDRLSQITSADPDFALLWKIRIAAEFQADFVDCVLAAAQPIVSAQSTVAPILDEIEPEQKRRMQKTRDGKPRQDAVNERFFFRADGKIYFPNDYEHRPEVRRVVRELQQLRFRVNANYQRERSETERLMTEHAPDRVDASGVSLELVKLLSVAEPSPYDGRVDVALYFSGFKFVPPSEMQPRNHRGVVHLSIENTIDDQSGKPLKRMTLHAVIGNIERTLPAVGTRWDIELANYGEGELGLRKGFNHADDKPIFAHLRHVQQVLFLDTKERKRTVSQALGLAAYQAYEAYRQEKRRPKKDGKGKPEGQQAQGAAAPAAESPADGAAPAAEQASGASDPTAAATPTGRKPGGGRNRNRGNRKATGDGGNGVAPGAAATPAPADGDPPPTT